MRGLGALAILSLIGCGYAPPVSAPQDAGAAQLADAGQAPRILGVVPTTFAWSGGDGLVRYRTNVDGGYDMSAGPDWDNSTAQWIPNHPGAYVVHAGAALSGLTPGAQVRLNLYRLDARAIVVSGASGSDGGIAFCEANLAVTVTSDDVDAGMALLFSLDATPVQPSMMVDASGSELRIYGP